jgi:hypothetical protein
MMRALCSAEQVIGDAFQLARQWRARGCEFILRYVNIDPHERHMRSREARNLKRDAVREAMQSHAEKGE